MPSSEYVGKHRAAPAQNAESVFPVQLPAPRHLSRSKRVRKNAVRNVLGLTGAAAAATGAAVVAGVVHTPAVAVDLADAVGPAASVSPAATDPTLSASELQQREKPIASRSFDRRTNQDPAKQAALGLSSGAAAGPAVSGRENVAAQDPRTIGQALLSQFGWSSSQFGCLDLLWNRESGWRVNAENSSSGAYGIPQSLPASKMGTIAGDYLTNPVTQITWGLTYIRASYGSPCGAWAHSESVGWY